jgi:hypothetical protein
MIHDPNPPMKSYVGYLLSYTSRLFTAAVAPLSHSNSYGVVYREEILYNINNTRQPIRSAQQDIHIDQNPIQMALPTTLSKPASPLVP